MANKLNDPQYMRYVHRKVVSMALQEMVNVSYAQLEMLKKKDSEE